MAFKNEKDAPLNMASKQSSVHVSSKNPKTSSSNRITNTKYSMISFPFMMIKLQFESAASVFFMTIILFQLFRAYRVTSLYTSVMPWGVIFAITILREFIDNYSRYVRDKEINTALYKKLNGTTFIDVESQNIRVGDIIRLEKGQRAPADFLLLKSEENSGDIFIRTDQLDGETDWKRRSAPAETQNCAIQCLSNIEADIEIPSKEIYSFTGKLKVNGFIEKREENKLIFEKEEHSTTPTKSVATEQPQEAIPEAPVASVKVDALVSKPSVPAEEGEKSTTTQNGDESVKEIGCDLDNTIWANTVVSSSAALGLVIYTGHDTRSMMNTNRPRNKKGIIESELDILVMIMAFISFFCSTVFTFLRAKTNFSHSWVIVCIRFVMIFSYVIPISLKFMITTARYLYVHLLSKDKELSSVKVLTNTLQEELARINFFLTDKTGTLTKNEMIMRKLHIGTVCFNAENTDEVINSMNKAMERDKKSKKGFWKKSKSSESKICDLIEALSVCHSVMPIESKDGIYYQASSPDEVAMVNYACEVGVRLTGRDNRHLHVQNPRGDVITYKILYTFQFNSDTKRMGIILKKDDEYIFFVKGADTVMKSIVKETDWIEEETDNMAREGLRTLVIAKKSLSESEIQKFEKAYNMAKMSLTDRNEKMLAEQCKLEKDLDVVGLTGVEDKLQDCVKQTLESLRNAGIKIWMLTGDKIETAISIAFSSRLLTKNDHYMIIAKCTSKQEIEGHLDALSSRGYNSLVVDGTSLEVIIDNFLDRFIDISRDLHCLVGCRYTPTQKAVMAASLRERANERVLCIGDGGNDVSMITQANVGVGIEGKEGSQASLAADFALKNFSQVAELLFVHGRRCYKNTSRISHLIFHRGMMVSTIQGIFCSLIRFFPISILQGKMPLLFTMFTIFPLFWVIIDQDISKSLSMQFPELFRELQMNNLLSIRLFCISLAVSIFQAAAFVLLYMNLYRREMFLLSVVCFTNLVVNEQFMVLISVSEKVNMKIVFICFASLICYIISVPFLPETQKYSELSKTWIILLMINLIAIFPKFLYTLCHLYINPPAHIKLARQKFQQQSTR